ncbi:MAG TPA: glutamate--tRNA ligase [Candidatus Veblenbacteria bacterium]|uniref:Glutamate--tRNA ligase n=1 Tax=Candidatus Veblenbacteria bacterium RIFOXYA2_FULL_43_9 TaxID=1802425 RepID=A0A1G2Q4J6_9BACT|nr:MAG: Glutamate-tRNA ligase [Parcubacteria group bacterium GW2011_GWA2_42_80]OHA55515.1 MAG: glutamate--tRNA ligase [Candidatus Veblenbacteria bacterium RIFOXYA2_FULL_43_9]HBH17231.1 glutamate--tRNA ligase [Candidatus Veblenbacteria bacterium]HBZ36676.1 glutamate--tRNA ligase [Candidatus Veblenbacteria bacterium]
MVRVRFAPSPTGELHLGSARTALYNYLFAKKNDGKFIMRLEDTDQERLVEGSLKRMLGGLAWLGLTWDEGPDIGGPYVPYIQSERLPIYKKQADELINQGGAYYCFCSAQRLEVLRRVQEAEKQITKYDRACLNLKPEEIKAKLEAKLPYIVRLKIPAGQTIFNDLIRGQIKVDNTSLDDSVLLKSDGFPTYHLANVVDDHLMEITHVIRGEEWLPSTPKHLLIYQGFGWSTPEFAHLPNVLNEKKTKLSKRKDGEAVWVQTYQAQGYLPEAMVNYLAFLGWHPKDDREFFTLADLTKEFDLSRAQKAGAIFNLAKLNWLNSSYLRHLPVSELDNLLKPYYEEMCASYNQAPRDTGALTELMRDRLITLASIKEHASWFFRPQVELNTEIIIPKNSTPEKTLHAIKSAHHVLQRLTSWTSQEIKDALEVLVRPGTFSRRDILWPVRLALTGEKESPDVFGVAWVLGQKETLTRLAQAESLLAD